MKKLFLILTVLLFGIVSSLFANNEIEVKGPVVVSKGDADIVQDLLVWVEIRNYTGKIETREEVEKYEIDNKKACYKHYLPIRHVNKEMGIKAHSAEYAQANTIEFVPTQSATYSNPIFLKQKKYIAADYVEEVNSKLKKPTAESINESFNLLDEALVIYPSPTIYVENVKILSTAIQNKIPFEQPPEYFIDRIVYDKNFKELDDTFRYNLLRRMGNTFDEASSSTDDIEAADTYYRVALRAYDLAISAATLNAGAVQDKYRLQQIFFNDWDAIETIDLYFVRNPNVKTQATVKGFLSDWLTSIERVSQKSMFKTSDEYFRTINSNPNLKNAWTRYQKVVSSHEYLLKPDNSSQAIRIKESIRVSSYVETLGGN